MYKKSILFFTVFMSIFAQSASIMPSYFNSTNDQSTEKLAAAAARGFFTEWGNVIQNASPETTQAFLNSILKGFSQSLTGDEFKKLCENLQKSFDKESDAQQAANSIIDFNTGNINRFVNNGILNNVTKLQGILITSAIIFFTAQYGIPMAFRMIERQLMRPKLIISSSKKGFFSLAYRN